MIASFFQSLSDAQVRYLLISGQATVLYGASTFSEDIDLWVDPAESNRKAFLGVLAAHGARYYKLTPPFTVQYLNAGHGFHFVIDQGETIFLDVMGRPPRVTAFEDARRDSRVFAVAWGDIPVIGIKHLVDIKKTQRASDYPVIGQLVLRYLESVGSPTGADHRWAVDNMFSLPELRQLIEDHPDTSVMCGQMEGFRDYASQVAAGGTPSEEQEKTAERCLAERVLACQAEDRRYWRDIIGELRELRRRDALMPEGAVVRP